MKLFDFSLRQHPRGSSHDLSRLDPEIQLTLLTDGVVEARNPGGKLLGFERTRELSIHAAQDIALAAQSFGQEDDITVLTLSMSPASVAA